MGVELPGHGSLFIRHRQLWMWGCLSMNAEFASSGPPFCLEEETPEQNHQDRGAHQKP